MNKRSCRAGRVLAMDDVCDRKDQSDNTQAANNLNHSRILSGEEVFDLLDNYVAADVGDSFCEGELFGAGFYAVLGEAALLDAAVAGEGA